MSQYTMGLIRDLGFKVGQLSESEALEMLQGLKKIEARLVQRVLAYRMPKAEIELSKDPLILTE